MIGNDAGELLPCPHCGGEAERYTSAVGVGFENRQVQCRTCGASAFDKKWQARTTPASAGVLVEALTPSAATKAAYIGEFGFNIVDRDEDGDEIYRRVLVPWDIIKEIMAAIAARQALSTTATPASDGVTEAAKALFEHEMRCRQVAASWDDVDEDDRRGWQQSVDVVLAATPDRFGEGYRAGVEASAKVAEEASLNSKRMEERQLNDAEGAHSLAGRDVSVESAVGFAKRASAASAIAKSIRALQPATGETA